MKKPILTLSIFALISTSIYAQNVEISEPVLERAITRTSAGEYLNKQIYEYDAVNNLLIVRWYFWDRNTDSWVVNRKFKYDNNDNQTLYTFYLWNADASAWILSHKSTFELGSNDIPIVFAIYSRHNETWQMLSQTKHDFEAGTNPMTYFTRIHDAQTGTWTKVSKHEVFYNHHGSIDFFIAHRKNAMTNYQWQKILKSEYIYDENNRLIMRKQHTPNRTTGDWQLISIASYYYAVGSRNYATAGSLSDAVVFPNPATNYITIRGAESSALTIFDLSGRVVFRQESIAENQIIPVATWNTGMYLVVIQTGSEKSVHKIIKR